MFSLSVKELRNKLPMVRSQLKNGESFLIIFKNRPIAKLTPIEEADSDFDEEDFQDASMSDIEDVWGDLSNEEEDYYLNLPEWK